MKKTFLLFIAALVSLNGFAQKSRSVHEAPSGAVHSNFIHSGAHSRTTAIGDTVLLKNISSSDTITQYYYGTDSGFVNGTNAYGDMGFAERYSFNGDDSSMKVLGIFAQFGGKINASSTRTVNFKTWNATDNKSITATLAYNGFPKDAVDTLIVPVTQLGIGPVMDTLKSFLFPGPPPTVSGSFFVGIDLSYNFATLAGDTFGVASSKDGERTHSLYDVYVSVSDLGDTTRDTVIYVQNATLWSDNTWHDNYTDNDSLFNDLVFFPIVAIGNPTGINGITRNNLTLFGCYPNPAGNSTNVRFSLAKNSNVTLQVMSMSGQTVQSIDLTGLQAGEHIVPLQTAELPQGNYLYLVRCATEEGIAGQLTIVK